MISLREPTVNDQHKFIAAMKNNADHFYPFVPTITTEEAFKKYLERYKTDDCKAYLAVNTDNEIIGTFNLSQMIFGAFQSAYLGFNCFKPFLGKGLMSQGLKILLQKAFAELKLHRLEANIQPENIYSTNLVSNNGFIKQGFSKNYLYIENAWRNHERWAITSERWQQQDKLETQVHDLCEDDFIALDKYFGENSVYKNPVSKWENYLEECQHLKRLSKVIKINNETVGIANLKIHSEYPYFKQNNIPEINDLLIAQDFRIRGYATKLIRTMEMYAKNFGYQQIGIGVGLYEDYGNAQKLYFDLGFKPDGNGITYQYNKVIPGRSYAVDDELIYWHVKNI